MTKEIYIQIREVVDDSDNPTREYHFTFDELREYVLAETKTLTDAYPLIPRTRVLPAPDNTALAITVKDFIVNNVVDDVLAGLDRVREGEKELDA